MVKNYHTVARRIIGQSVSGTRTHLLSDAMGSITTTASDAGVVLNTYRLKPYGGLLARSGGAADPKFRWTGSLGSRLTGLPHAEQYNRNRHYSCNEAAWVTVDPLWPDTPAYLYGNCSPTNFQDPFGLESCADCSPSAKAEKLSAKCEVVDDPLAPGFVKIMIYKCMKLSCETEGSSVWPCRFTQRWTLREYRARKLFQSFSKLELDLDVVCPGQDWWLDAPGISAARRNLKTPCEEKLALPMFRSSLLARLPWVSLNWFEDKCICGEKTSTVTWSFGFEIRLDKSGGYECNFISL